MPRQLAAAAEPVGLTADPTNENVLFAFNLAHTLRQMLHLRPRNRFEDVDGVYLVGGGTHPGSGLPVIYESARITSRLLLDDLGVAGGERPAALVTGAAS